MAKVETIIKRENGSEARILVLDFTSPFSLQVDYEVCIFSRNSDKENWNRILDTPERQALSKKMSVEEFIKNGRNPIFSVVSTGEILLAVNGLFKQYPKLSKA